jgi:NAD(P)-dependent dehydrogenase (short-subunit alcohol dehydrogenase family)
MDLGLRGKTAIVTGGSQGIGREIATALHREGVALMLVAHREEGVQQAAKEIAALKVEGEHAPAYAAAADLSMRTEVERVVEQAMRRLGHVDILINNAARARSGDFFRMTPEELEESWQVKGLGYVRMVRALAPHMMQRQDGRIVNIIGSAARTPTSDFIVGSMVNAALVNFTRGISRELARYNVRINAISPGWTMTEKQARSFAMQASARKTTVEDVERQQARGIPLSRLVGTGEIATLALMLVSDLLPSMTGEDIVIDGGAMTSI